MHTPRCISQGQRTSCRNKFSLFTIWALRTELRLGSKNLYPLSHLSNVIFPDLGVAAHVCDIVTSTNCAPTHCAVSFRCAVFSDLKRGLGVEEIA